MEIPYKIITSTSGNPENLNNKSLQSPWTTNKNDDEKYIILELELDLENNNENSKYQNFKLENLTQLTVCNYYSERVEIFGSGFLDDRVLSNETKARNPLSSFGSSSSSNSKKQDGNFVLIEEIVFQSKLEALQSQNGTKMAFVNLLDKDFIGLGFDFDLLDDSHRFFYFFLPEEL